MVLSMLEHIRLKFFCALQIVYRAGAGWPAGHIGRRSNFVKRDGVVGLVRAGLLPEKLAQ